MTRFEARFFKKVSFSDEEIEGYLQGTQRDLATARSSAAPEVRFVFAYNALIKGGITLLAKKGGVKVRSVPGHHARILEKMSELLDDDEVADVGNAMRMKRNLDFYGGGQIVTRKEADEYFEFVDRVVKQVEARLST